MSNAEARLFGEDPGEVALDFRDNTGVVSDKVGTHASVSINTDCVAV